VRVLDCEGFWSLGGRADSTSNTRFPESFLAAVPFPHSPGLEMRDETLAGAVTLWSEQIAPTNDSLRHRHQQLTPTCPSMCSYIVLALLCGVFVRLRLALFSAGGPFLPSLSVSLYCSRVALCRGNASLCRSSLCLSFVGRTDFFLTGNLVLGR
jgi:hypothetical protein